MSEPRRWKDSADAPVGMRELLASARPSRSIDDATFRRGAKRIASVSLAPTTILLASFWTKLAAAGAIGLATAGTVAAVIASSNEVAPMTPQAIASPVVAPPPPREIPAPTPSTSTPEQEPAPAPAPAIGPAPAARPPAKMLQTAAPAPEPPSIVSSIVTVPEEPEQLSRPKSTLADELGLLQRARGHLARSPDTALTELAEHRALYPSGALAAERDLMELDALRRAGRVQEAKSRALAWLARDPQGIHAARVRQILSTIE